MEILIGLVLGAFLAAGLAIKLVARKPPSQLASGENCLLIAHPDDETMFFLPTCRSLKIQKVICLSTGDAEGLGEVRKTELRAAANLLGMDQVIFGSFPDGFSYVWSPEEVASFVQNHVNPGSNIITFDKLGVSGHPNHVACFYGALKLAEIMPTLRIYSLKSERSLLRKYSGTCGALLDLLSISDSDDSLLLVNREMGLAHKLMSIHASQYVWYRRLFVLFAQFIYVNKLDRQMSNRN